MKEIGGYIELDRYSLPLLHEGAIALNCARNALAYLIRAKKIRKIIIPKFLCDSVMKACKREGAEIRYYAIGLDLLPCGVELGDGEWLYLVNYYGQLDNSVIKSYKEKYDRVIVDNVQAYFQPPVDGVDTIYTCRKFFGVADGAFLYTDVCLDGELERDESHKRMSFLLGRFERTASEFYSEYVKNNDMLEDEDVKFMSRLTDNLLRGIDYDTVKKVRRENFALLHERLAPINGLELNIPDGAFMYPLYVKDGARARAELQKIKIYIPTLWPDVYDICGEDELEYDMAKNILSLPCDQRYGKEDMEYIVQKIKECVLDTPI